MKAILVAIILFISHAGFCQPILTVDNAEVRIGDQVKATIQADLSNDKEWINLKEVWPDTLRGVEVVQGPAVDSTNPSSYVATWTLSIFDTGMVSIPSLPVIIGYQGRSDTFYTHGVPVRVLPVEPDSAGLAEIKEVYLEPFNPGYYKKYIPHALGFLLLMAGLILWLKQRKSKRVIPEPVAIPLLPHEWGLKALDELASKKLWQRGEVKPHYSELTAILREYLERRYGIHAREQTSDEILAQLRHLQLNPQLLDDTEELVSIADLIKFAKADPGMDIHTAAIERVRSFILETRPQLLPPESRTSKPGEDGGME